MAPVGISLVNLLIESTSLSLLAEGRQAKKEFAQNFSSSVSSREPSKSPTTANLLSSIGGDDGTKTEKSISSTSSCPFSKTTSSNLNNNNYFRKPSQEESTEISNGKKYFSEAEPKSSSSASTQRLYTYFWEKFKKPFDQVEVNNTHTLSGFETKKSKREEFKNNTSTSVSFQDKTSSLVIPEKFCEGAKQINSQLTPVWSLLSYPSDLHYYGRIAVMTTVTGFVIEKTLENLPDIEQLGKIYGPYLYCTFLDGSDPNQPGRIGLDKDFF